MSSAVPEEAELSSSEPQWSGLLKSRHFSRTSLHQDGVEYSIFTRHPATILVPRLRLSTGVVRGLSVFCSWAYIQRLI